MILRILYSAFLGILLLNLFWTGLDAFYPEPLEVGQQPYTLSQNTAEYRKMVVVGGGVLSLLLTIAGTRLLSEIPVLAEGAVFGGILVFFFSRFEGFGMDKDGKMFIFVVVLVVFVFSILFGLKRFEKEK